MNAIMAVEMIIVGKYYNFEVFTKTPGWVFFFLFFITTEVYIILAIFFSTLISTKEQAFTGNFIVILCSLVCNIILSEPTLIKKVFFNQDMPPWVSWATRSFYLLPCFQFGKMFSDITSVVCFSFDPENMNWVKSERDFEYKDIYRIQEGTFFSKDKYVVTSFYDTAWTLLYISFLYGFLAWYFDNFLPKNRGVTRSFLFFLQPSFWFPSVFGQTDVLKAYNGPPLSVVKDKVTNEDRKSILEDEKSGKTIEVNGVRVLGLSKTYKSILSNEETHALRDVYFQIKKGELMCVMGHNGAGKSTLINTLCGLVVKDAGNARIYDKNIHENLRFCRKRMGVVSQFDVLWDELTGIEHMYLF